MFEKLSKYFHTARFLHPSQIYYRLRAKLRPYWLEAGEYPLPEHGEQTLKPQEVPRVFAMQVEERSEGADAFVEGRFEFVGIGPVDMEPVDWGREPEGDLLWTFCLHYFEWAMELARAWRATETPAYAHTAFRAIFSWMEENAPGDGMGWHPYPTSRRVVSWSRLLAALDDAPQWSEMAGSVLASIEQQVDYLADWTERDLKGNHLLANYSALAWVSVHLGDLLSERIQQKLSPFRQRYWAELNKQVRSDGCHEENATSYHLLVLKDAFEQLLLEEQLGVGAPALALGTTERMFDFLASLVRPDGSVPMVNDAVEGYPMEAADLLAAGASWFDREDWKYAARGANLDYLRWTLGEHGVSDYRALDANPPEREHFDHRDSGYYVFRTDWSRSADWALFDCGPIGPDHQPGHAHADTLNVLLVLDGTPVLVDPGVGTYRAGEVRTFARSTAAHNTVEVDGVDQSEMWSEFRVARRARATLENWSERGRVSGAHDGYRRLDDPVHHRRTLQLVDPGRWQIRDRLTAEGAKHRYALHFQLAPGCTGVERGSGGSIRAKFDSGLEVTFEIEASAPMELESEGGRVFTGWRREVHPPRLVARVETSGRIVTFRTRISAASP